MKRVVFPVREANRNPDLRSPTKAFKREAMAEWMSTSALVVFSRVFTLR